MIELQHVTKMYGTVIGVNDLSLTLPAGAYGLLGPNGSGKSTLLNLVTGQLRPTQGSLRVLGESPWGNRRLYARLGVCPERDVLYRNVTGFEWVCYLLELHGFGSAAARQRARSVLAQVGLADAGDRPIGGYSLGMRQRCKLAQALAHEPQLLILDEPFNGLDPVARHEMTVLLRSWIRQGRSLLLASHVLHEVESITQSFLLICGGRLLASGSAEEVHALLADIPSEVYFRGEGLAQLARLLIEARAADEIRFTGTDVMVAATRHPAALFEQLPHWLGNGSGIRIAELRSPDESLQDLFDSLLRIHRGER